MKVEYFGLDRKAQKEELFSHQDQKIESLQNEEKYGFKFFQKGIRLVDLFRFKDVFISSCGAVFKGFSISRESVFHTGLEQRYFPFFKRLKFFKRNYLKKKTINLEKAVLFCDPWSLINYHHWLCDAMMRFSAVLPKITKDHILVIPYEKHSVKENIILDSIKAFGFSKDQILQLKPNQKIKAKELLMPSHITHNEAVYFRSDLVNILRDKLPNYYKDSEKLSIGDKIYISRKKAAYRKIANENELIVLLKKYDFSIINMEDYSFGEQISIVNNAKYLISCHGAGLANILFMKKNSFVIELINENLNRPHFYALASAANLNYSCLKSKQEIPDFSDENEANIMVDLSKLEQNLKKIIN